MHRHWPRSVFEAKYKEKDNISNIRGTLRNILFRIPQHCRREHCGK
jgi:hypothetical protein